MSQENVEVVQAAELPGVAPGRITEWRIFMREPEALEAVGLSD